MEKRAIYRRENGNNSGLQKAGGHAVVAVELHVVEGGGDSVPAGHGGELATLDVSASGQDDIAVAHRLADQNNFNFDRSADRERPRAEEVNASGADVARDERDRRFLRDTVHAA